MGFDHISLKLRLLSLSIAGQVTKSKDDTRTQHPPSLECHHNPDDPALPSLFLPLLFFSRPYQKFLFILALCLANAILNEFQSSFCRGVADKTTHDLLRSLVHLPS